MFKTESGEIFEYDISKNILVPSKKNEKQIVINSKTGKSFIVGTNEFQRWQKNQRPLFNNFYSYLFDCGISLPIVRCKLKIIFYFPDSRRRDLGNKAETIYDELKDAGIIADDDFKVLKPIVLDGWVQRDRPRTEIYITIIPPSSSEYNWDKTPASYVDKLRARRAIQAKIRRAKKK